MMAGSLVTIQLFLKIATLYLVWSYSTAVVSGRTAAELADFIRSQKYNNDVRPNATGAPLSVMIQIYILSLGPIDEEKQEFLLEMYFRESWRDSTLSFQSNTTDYVNLVAELGHRLWYPNTYFENGRDPVIQKIPADNRFFRIYTDGTVMFSSRIQCKVMCQMDFRRFPLDTQKCYLKLASYGMSIKDVEYKWHKDKGVIILSKNLRMAQFYLGSDITTRSAVETFISGSFMYLFVDFRFKRMMDDYISNYYVPASMIVVLSWLAFWIAPHSVPARVSVGVITVLTMSQYVQDGFGPQTAYATAMDVYLFVCFTFVFMAFIEFAVLHHNLKKESKNSNNRMVDNGSQTVQICSQSSYPGIDNKSVEQYELEDIEIPNGNVSDQHSHQTTLNVLVPVMGRVLCRTNPLVHLDGFCKIAFPVTFVLFNVVYWVYFLLL